MLHLLLVLCELSMLVIYFVNSSVRKLIDSKEIKLWDVSYGNFLLGNNFGVKYTASFLVAVLCNKIAEIHAFPSYYHTFIPHILQVHSSCWTGIQFNTDVNSIIWSECLWKCYGTWWVSSCRMWCRVVWEILTFFQNVHGLLLDYMVWCPRR
jgi:hypothetical protein